MKRNDILISLARSMSENAPVSSQNDISDEEFLQYMNDAQDRCQALISNSRNTSKIFVKERIIDAVANQEEYAITDRVFFNKTIEQIEYSHDGTLSNYRLLEKLSFMNRDTNADSYPRGYYRRFGKFYPVPIVSVAGGKFRVMFERSLDDLEKRRATVASVAGLTSTTFTSITLTDPDESSSPINFTNVDYVCVCNKDGTVKAYNIPVGTYTAATNVLTPTAGFTFIYTGETIAAGDFVTFHKYTTTHSTLPDECERYLLHYTAESILHRDSSMDIITKSEILKRMEKDIVDIMKNQTGEVQYVPQMDINEWW